MKNSWLWWLITGFLISILGYLLWQPSHQATTTIERPETNADFFFDSVNIKSFDESGRQTNRIYASKIEYFKQDNQSVIDVPQVTLNSNQGNRWSVNATNGKIDHQNKTLKLSGDVSISQKADNISAVESETNTSANQSTLSSDSIIKASELFVNLMTNEIYSDKPVSIITGMMQTDADGLKANINIDKIELIGNVSSKRISDEN